MKAIHQDWILIGVLLVVSIAWVVMARTAIPLGYSGSIITPRTFPETLGILLAVLSLILLVQTIVKRRRGEVDEGEASEATFREELWAFGISFGFLLVYYFALQVLGFIAGTILVVAGFLILVLKQRSPMVIAGLSLGLGIGLYLLMNKLLGVQLPAGMLGLVF